jgi:hypothetical protein
MKLGYRQHGGSGLGFPPEYVLSLPVDEARWYCERLDREREAEAKALAAARGR